jgi:hypothetical protein
MSYSRFAFWAFHNTLIALLIIDWISGKDAGVVAAVILLAALWATRVIARGVLGVTAREEQNARCFHDEWNGL